jgi:hypothetical protein
MGLFGVLSIIRLRSYEIDQHEIAYYFAALSLGLLAGLSSEVNVLSVSLMLLVLAAMFIVDHPKLHSSWRQQKLSVPGVFANELELRSKLEAELGVVISKLIVKKLDMQKQQTDVEIRYQVATASPVVKETI